MQEKSALQHNLVTPASSLFQALPRIRLQGSSVSEMRRVFRQRAEESLRAQ